MTPAQIVILTASIGAVVSLVAFLLNRSLFKKMDEMSSELKKYALESQQFKETVLKDFVTKAEMFPNNLAHEKIWTEVNSLRERVAKIEPD